TFARARRLEHDGSTVPCALSNEEDSYVTSVSGSSDDSSVVSYSVETLSSNEEHNWEFEADMVNLLSFA
nr:hypothetical protein [Tanacetum cinerariifolium]